MIVTVSLAAVPRSTSGQLAAHFRAKSIVYDESVEDCDFCAFGCTPTCELYFTMGIWSNGIQQGALETFPGGCTSYSHELGGLDFPDQVIDRALPDLSTSATFYFAMFDEDDVIGLDDDDLLGAHTVTRSAPQSPTEWNNDNLPTGAVPVACDGGSVDDDSWSRRFTLDYDIWFTDATAPTVPGAPFHADATANPGWDDDSRLDFSWTPAADPHSGVSSYQVVLQKDGVTIASPDVGQATLISVCGTACTIAHTPVEGSTYQVFVRAFNGDSVSLTPESPSAYSDGNSPVGIDRTAPVTSITAPSDGSWQRTSFLASVADSDANLAACTGELVSGLDPGFWFNRTCGDPVPVDVGPAPALCSVEGSPADDVCRLYIHSADSAGNATTDLRKFGVDYTADPMGSVSAKTGPAGEAIPGGSWTSDTTPYVWWPVPASVSPIETYSWGIDTEVDCVGDTSSSFVDLSTSPLAEGTRRFEVRALDAAGNCGETAELLFRIDATADPIASLVAASEPEGEPIEDGTPQEADTVRLTWTAPSSTSPITGYSHGIGLPQDCDLETSALTTVIGPLDVGTHGFWVRALDAAGNCGPTSELDVVVAVCTLLELSFETVAGTVEEESCAIAVGPDFDVAEAGFLTLRARKRVVLGSGFSVSSGGSLAVILDPSVPL